MKVAIEKAQTAIITTVLYEGSLSTNPNSPETGNDVMIKTQANTIGKVRYFLESAGSNANVEGIALHFHVSTNPTTI